MRRFLGWLVVDASSFSDSLASRLTPAVLLCAGAGVSGGVVMGMPVTLPELVAAMLGILPPIKGGLFMIEIDVAIDEVEFDRVGEAGRPPTNEVVAGGEGAAKEVAELRCW